MTNSLEQKKALVFGGRTGLLGKILTKALERRGAETLPLSRSDLDPLDEKAVRRLLQKEKPDFVFNAVAYTQVDLAEDEPEQAYLLNRDLPALLSRQCRDSESLLIHFSTDFVFDGLKDGPYVETDPPGPQSVYGRSKLDGERALSDSGYAEILIIRTAWLFGPKKMNFVKKILQLAEERDRLTVVDDQSGSPTYAPDLAKGSIELAETGARGIFHLANSGSTTWHGLASKAVALAGLDCVVKPVPTSAYPTKAKRPANSILNTDKFTKATGTKPRPWEEALEEYILRELPQESKG